MNTDRRNILKGAVMVGAGAALVAESAHAQPAPKVLFEAPRTTIPIVGTSDLFSVRRIYCILRIPMHPAMHSNMKPAGDSDLIPATLLASTGPFR